MMPTMGGGDAADGAALEAEVMKVMKQYVEMGGSLNPEEAPPEMRELLLAMQSGQLPIGGMGGGPNIPGPASAPPPGGQGEDIVPEPGFVLKTADDNGRKVFINICGSSKVASPGDWSKGKMPPEVEKAIKQAEDNQENFTPVRFPLSLGEPRNDLDKEGRPCTVFDMVFNDDVASQACAHRQLKDFLCNLSLQWVGQKHGLALDERYKLPKMKYKGNVKQNAQRVRVDPKMLIEEVEGDAADEEPTFPLSTQPRPATVPLPPGGLKQARKEAEKLEEGRERARRGAGGAAAAGAEGKTTFSFGAAKAAKAEARGHDLLAKVEYESRPVEAVLITVQLPPKAAAPEAVRQARVEVLRETVTVEVPGCKPLSVELPLAVTGAGGSAAVNARGMLNLRLPHLPYKQVVEQLRAVAPFKFGELSLENDSYLELEP